MLDDATEELTEELVERASDLLTHVTEMELLVDGACDADLPFDRASIRARIDLLWELGDAIMRHVTGEPEPATN